MVSFLVQNRARRLKSVFGFEVVRLLTSLGFLNRSDLPKNFVAPRLSEVLFVTVLSRAFESYRFCHQPLSPAKAIFL